MKGKQVGNSQLPDFKQLNDRVIAETSNEPMLVIKTNLDPKDVTVENPYYDVNAKDEEKFSTYFGDHHG